MKKKILVVGSVTYDIIFAVQGNIKDELHVRDGSLDRINMMFTAKDKERYYGGTGGNIAYGLGMLGENPLLFSIVGNDFLNDFKQHLEENHVILRLDIKKNKFTSTFYGISDEDFQQIGIFQPNAYYDGLDSIKLEEYLSEKDFSDIGYAIFSPGSGISIRNHMLELRNKLSDKVKIIFDPSQILSIQFNDDLLRECLSLCDIFIGNENEIKQLKTLYNYSVSDLLDLEVTYVIETKGEKGSIVHSKDGQYNILSIKPKHIIETTGAGDAFRSGLLYGLANGYDIFKSCQFGAITGARCVEEYGGQLYRINVEELK